MNCPPQLPCCNPCDCIFDYYDPLVFNGWNLSVEWLYLKVQQKASTFALTPSGRHQPFPQTTIADAIGKYQSAKFDWNPGVRATLDYTFVRDAWNFSGEYVYYGTTGHNQAIRPSDPTLYLEATNRGIDLLSPSDGVDKLVSKTFFRYQELDLLLSRRFIAGCQVILDFFAGATGAFIHEKWDITGLYTVGLASPVTTETQNHWRFNGGGIRLGITADWHMGCGLGLYNQFSFANLAGAYTNRRTTHFIPPAQIESELPVFNPVRDTTEKTTWVVPNTQIAFGASWNHRFDTVSMRILAGFEVNTWYSLHLLHQDATNPSFPNNDRLDIQNTSPVSLWGLNLGLEFSF